MVRVKACPLTAFSDLKPTGESVPGHSGLTGPNEVELNGSGIAGVSNGIQSAAVTLVFHTGYHTKRKVLLRCFQSAVC